MRDTLLGLVGDQPQQCVNGFFSTGSTDLDKIAKALGVDASDLSTTDKRMIILTLTDAGRKIAEKVGAIESQFYEANADLVKDAPLPEMLGLLWRFVEGKSAGMALARRIEKETRSDTLSL